MSPPSWLVLVYRAGCVACGRSCCPHAKGRGRQYAFEYTAELAAWCARKPYRDEFLTVIAFYQGLEIAREKMAAGEAVAFVQRVMP